MSGERHLNPAKAPRLGHQDRKIDVISKALWICWKDAVSEMRGKETWPLVFLLAILILVVFSVTFEFGELDPKLAVELAPGLLWIGFAFTAVLALDRSMASESGNGTLEALVVSGAGGGAILLGKLLFCMTLLLSAQVGMLLLVNVLLGVWLLGSPGWVLLNLVMGDVGFVTVGLVCSLIAQATRTRGAMLPVLLLPLAIPAVVAAAQCLGMIARGEPTAAPTWWGILAAFDIIFVTAGFLLFDVALEQ